MDKKEIMITLQELEAIITNSHFVYTNGNHGTAYVNKDAVYPDTEWTSKFCRAIAAQFIEDNVEVVIAPAIGGVILSQWIAYHLSGLTGRKVLGVYAEKSERSVIKPKEDFWLQISPTYTCLIKKGQELVVKENTFVIKRGYDKLVAGKNVLVVEDVLTTGDSAKKVVEAVRAIGGKVVGLGALCNRGGITKEDVGNVPKLFSLVNIKLTTYDPESCLLCAGLVPINTDVGKGREFLAQKSLI